MFPLDIMFVQNILINTYISRKPRSCVEVSRAMERWSRARTDSTTETKKKSEIVRDTLIKCSRYASF